MNELLRPSSLSLEPLAKSGYRRVAEALETESDLFVASEFLYSSDIADRVLGQPPAGTKLGRLIQQFYGQIPRENAQVVRVGLAPELVQAIRLLRDNLGQLPKDDREAALKSAVEEKDPDFLNSVDI